MSPQENRVAAELALWGALLLFIWMRLTDGTVILGQSLGTVIVEQSPGRLLFTYFAAGVIAATAFGATAAAQLHCPRAKSRTAAAACAAKL